MGLFTIAGRAVERLNIADAPMVQRLLERCGDYALLAEGRPPQPDAALDELTGGPPERVPQDLFCFGIPADEPGELAGVIGALRHHRRPGQWYLGLMLLDPACRGSGLGAAAYAGFEGWIRAKGAESVLLAVLEANHRAARFWERQGFGLPRCYPARTIGLRRHVLIEYEKTLAPGAAAEGCRLICPAACGSGAAPAALAATALEPISSP